MGVKLSSLAVQLALGGALYDKIEAHASLRGFWLLNEMLTTTGARDFYSTNNGTLSGFAASDLGQYGFLPHGGTCYKFDGTDAYVTMGDVASFEFTGTFTVEFIFKSNGLIGGAGMVGKAFSGTGAGWQVYMSAGKIRFWAYSSVPAAVFDVSTDARYDDSIEHHVVCTWDGTTAANGVKIYVDGVNVKSGTAVAGTIATNATHFMIGASNDVVAGTPNLFFNGWFQYVAVYNAALSSTDVTTHYNATQWTDVSADLNGVNGLTLEYGTQGTNPEDRVADTGTLEFTLQNWPTAAGRLRGKYSPWHVNCLSGFTEDIPVRVRMTYDGLTRTRFWGRVAVIAAEPNQYGPQTTTVTAHDYMYLLGSAELKTVTAQVSATETDLLKTIFEAMHALEQPMAIDFDASVDTFPYAFYNIQKGIKAITPVNHVVVSAWGRAHTTGDGTFTYLNRDATTNVIISYGLNDDMVELDAVHDRDLAFNAVRVTTHQKFVDPAANAILIDHPQTNQTGSSSLSLTPGQSLEFFINYRSQDQQLQAIGGVEMVTPVATTDYKANTAANGTGTDRTASLSVVATFFAAAAKLVITNNHGTDTIYVTKLQCRGKGVYDLSPVDSDAIDGNGERLIKIDLPYQDDEAIGQEIADYVLNERLSVDGSVHGFTLLPQRSDAEMDLAHAGEPGELLTITETQTGLLERQVTLRHIRLEISEGLWCRAQMGVSQIVIGYEWILDDANFGVMGTTTIFTAG